MKVKQGSKAELVVTDAEGKETRELIFNFEDTDGIIQGLHNKNNSIAGFARACFNYGLDLHQDVWFATKDTISKKYDHTFKDIFQEIFDKEYKEKFEARDACTFLAGLYRRCQVSADRPLPERPCRV